MDIALEKKCIKLLWAGLNSEYKVVKMVTLSSIKDPFVLTSTEIVQLIEYLYTIYISKLISLGDIISYLYYKPVYYCVPSCAEMTCIIALLCKII